MPASTLKLNRLFLTVFQQLGGFAPYTFLFLPGFDRTALEYITLGLADFSPDCFFAPFFPGSVVIAAEHVEGGWTDQDFAALFAALKNLNTKRLVIVGDSYGGQVAIRLFLWPYFHEQQPFEDIATILVGAPDGMSCIMEPFRTGAIDLVGRPDELRAFALQHAHDPMQFIDRVAQAALTAQGREALIPVIADSYQAAAPLIPGNVRQMVAFPGFASLLQAQVTAHAATGTNFGPISFGGRVLTINATKDIVVDADRTVASTLEVFGRFIPIVAESGPHGWLDIHPRAYAVALIQAMSQLCQRGFGPNLGWQ